MLKYILFDLDETLYPASSGVMNCVTDNMRQYIQDKYEITPQEAYTLQKRLFREYGTTLRGLMTERAIDPEEYLLFVHNIDIASLLKPDPELRQVLMQIPYEKYILTNADVPHAERILERLGVADQFQKIFDVRFMEFECKPARGVYERALRALDARGDECLLVEDSPRNLPPARELGIHTILLMAQAGRPESAHGFADPADIFKTLDCPPSAERCIDEIYQVADAIAQIAKSVLHPNPA